MRDQKGMSVIGIIVILILIGMVAVLGLKTIPSYLEYFQIKKAVAGIAASGETKGTVADVRKAFDRRAQIDDIQAITAADLEITKEGSELVISFSYPKKVHLFAQVNLLFEFQGNSKN